jgi:hypothetical protein
VKVYSEIWKADVPPKERVFAWKLARNGLATQENRHHRGLTRDRVSVASVPGGYQRGGYFSLQGRTGTRDIARKAK